MYRCRDGKWLSVGALEPKFWEGVCAALGRPELAGRKFEQGEARVHARAAVAAPPVKLSGSRATTIPPAPGLGEHTDAVLAEAGFTRADIEKMRGAGVLA